MVNPRQIPTTIPKSQTRPEQSDSTEDSTGLIVETPIGSPPAGQQGSNQMPTSPKITAAGRVSLIQGRFGLNGNWELVAVAGNGRLFHTALVRDSPHNKLWHDPIWFGHFLPLVSGLSLIQSNIGDPGNLELACVIGGAFYMFWRDCSNNVWHGGYEIWLPRKCCGNPALIQSSYGDIGNFEVIVPCVDRGFLHFPRLNDSNHRWGTVTWVGNRLQAVTAVTMIQSNYGKPGNFEVVCIANNQLYSLYRDHSSTPDHWYGPDPIHPHLTVTGNPVLIQSHAGTKGNFELVVPSTDGGLIHLSRNNDPAVPAWSSPTFFGQDLGIILDVSMIEFNSNMEVLCSAGGRFHQLSCRGGRWTEASTIDSSRWQVRSTGE